MTTKIPVNRTTGECLPQWSPLLKSGMTRQRGDAGGRGRAGRNGARS